MIYFAAYLCIAIAFAKHEQCTQSNATFFECFTHEDCIRHHSLPYCYAGACTDRCPPGYNQTNHGHTFNCTCDRSKNFVTDGYFGKPFDHLHIPICTCEPGWIPFCDTDVWAEGIGYTDGVVPKGTAPNCKLKRLQPEGHVTTFALIVMIASSVLFLIINIQSCSGIIYDFHRYVALYILGTLPLIAFVQTVHPFKAGFTRSMAFGVMMHNAAEWNLIIRLQYGKTMSARASANLCVMCYYIIFLIGIVFLDMALLLFVSIVQGGFLDFSLLFFTCIGGRTIKDDKNPANPVLGKCCPTERSSFQWMFGCAATFHLLTVEVLFAGFVSNDSLLVGGGAFLLVPMFLLYTCWASREDRTTRLCGPRLLMNYEKREGKTPNFWLVPFKHTSHSTDILWQRFIGRSYPPPSNEELELLEVEKALSFGSSVAEGIKIEDCENFRFGINDEVHKCCCGGSLFNWIPIYWVAALIAITINGAIIYFMPQSHKCCGDTEGYYYGAW